MKRGGGRREAKIEEIEEDEKQNLSKSAAGVSDADDDDGGEDLSLKLVEKSLMRKAMLDRNNTNGVVLVDPGLGSASDSGLEKLLVTQDVDTCPGGSKKKRRKKKKSQIADQSVTIASEEKRAETVEEVEPVEEVPAVEADGGNGGDVSVNAVLQKLLRGPRYFDPPASGAWPSCYNCGEEGHMLANCPSFTKKKKPCHLCGSLDHGARQCRKDQDCFICKQVGHRAKDCPEKYKVVSKICLRCGHSGHHMFSCSKEYSHDDLKEIRCYICKSLGHLCCANYADGSSIKVSCYKCGELGHTGLSCSRLLEENTSNASPSFCYKCGGGHFAHECSNSTRFHDDGTVTASLSSCYKCHEGGHFARECRSYAKARKINYDSSTSAPRARTEVKDNNDEGGYLAWEYISSAKARKRNNESPTPALRAHTEIKDNNDEGGHLAREHKSSTKARKRNHESSTPALIAHTEIKDNNVEVKSAPHDLGKKKKKKRGKTISEHKSTSTPPKAKRIGRRTIEDSDDLRSTSTLRKEKRLRVKGNIVYSNDLQRPGTGTPSKSRHRGAWITEDPEDFYTPNAKQNSWRSPSKPSYDRASGPHMSTPQSFKQMRGSQSGTPGFHGSAPAFQQGFHSSRLNSSSPAFQQQGFHASLLNSSSPAFQQQGFPASRVRSSPAFEQDYPYTYRHIHSHSQRDSYHDRHPPSKLASFQNRFSTSRLDSEPGYDHGYSESRCEQFGDSRRVGNHGRHGTSGQYGWR